LAKIIWVLKLTGISSKFNIGIFSFIFIALNTKKYGFSFS